MANPTQGLTSVTFTPRDLERYWSKVEKSDGCWFWRPALNPAGYGTFTFRRINTSAHRAGYLIARGEIPQGLVLDHLCRVRHCVNPDHLEAVTPSTNTLRSPLVHAPTCSKGHEFTPENTRMYVSGSAGVRSRYCLECTRTRSRESMRRQRAKAKAGA